MNENTVLSFSGGRTSALMTIELLKDEKYKNAVVIFANTGKENEATLKFVHQVSQFLNDRIIWVEYNPDPAICFNVVTYETASRKGEPFAALIEKRKFCPNRVARFCTQELKIRPMKKYCKKVLQWEHWVNMVGIRYDEPHRYAKTNSVAKFEVFDVEHPLVRWKITKPQVLAYWQKMPFDLQLKEHEGNCDVCFLKGKKKHQTIARETPQKFDWWIAQEQKVSGNFIKRYSYSQLRDWVQKQPEFNFSDEVQCFCNVD